LADLPRRRFLQAATAGGAAAGLAAVMPAGLSGNDPAAVEAPAPTARAFHGFHQAGVVEQSPAEATIASFDVLAANKAELADLFKTITEQARLITAGQAPPDAGPKAPPADNGLLGPLPTSEPELMLTVGVGASLFDDRFGLAPKKPSALKPMPTFPDDNLDPPETHGDLSIQFASANRDSVLHALRQIARHTRGGMQLRWKVDGFTTPRRPDGSPRNLLGFKDGTSNPDTNETDLMDRLVWVHGDRNGEPRWTDGGTYQVVRIIRLLVEFWDRVALGEQETMIGAAQGHRRTARRQPRAGRPGLRRRPEGRVDLPGRPHPPGEPSHQGHGSQPHPAPRLQLRPRHRRQRQPRHGFALQQLPAGPGPPVRGHPEASRRRTAGRLHQPHRRRLLLRPPLRSPRPRPLRRALLT